MNRTGPRFPQAHDLPAWKAWQRRQQPLIRRAKATVTPQQSRVVHIHHDGAPVHTLVALESLGPTQRAAILAPLKYLRPTSGVAYVVSTEVSQMIIRGMVRGEPAEAQLPTRARVVDVYRTRSRVPSVLRSVRSVVAVGNYLPAGAQAYCWARAVGAQFVVVQHGLLAYQAPPLPEDAHLLAFTPEDAAWWSAGRQDVVSDVVGSQLLWGASHRPPEPSAENKDTRRGTAHQKNSPGVFLGQMHGAELPRKDFFCAAASYCQETGAAYRPHPAEQDRLSRLLHAVLRRRGIDVVPNDNALDRTEGAVTAVFSTGVLEAAAAGRRSWVFHPNPPDWLQDFWQRYGMSRWLPGETADPTPAPRCPAMEPARAIARLLFAPEEWRADADTTDRDCADTPRRRDDAACQGDT
ncbi:MAG: RNA-binding protein [Kocuria sp.]|nr:RNA-binding protein [Kocuria sp.]